jgi:hypothetical protein
MIAQMVSIEFNMTNDSIVSFAVVKHTEFTSFGLTLNPNELACDFVIINVRSMELVKLIYNLDLEVIKVVIDLSLVLVNKLFFPIAVKLGSVISSSWSHLTSVEDNISI